MENYQLLISTDHKLACFSAILISIDFLTYDQIWSSTESVYWSEYDLFISIDSVLIKADQMSRFSTLLPERLKCGKNWLQPRCQNFRLKDTILISILFNIVSDKTEIEAAFENVKSSEMFDFFSELCKRFTEKSMSQHDTRWDEMRVEQSKISLSKSRKQCELIAS